MSAPTLRSALVGWLVVRRGFVDACGLALNEIAPAAWRSTKMESRGARSLSLLGETEDAVMPSVDDVELTVVPADAVGAEQCDARIAIALPQYRGDLS
ncbi:hypothetical protein Pla52n_12800 [Stieleria varia]|uniref:Uncharacterized protein n=1 Tax=Stieleria varia TaxID=2528005 RepID=A0A5C6B2U4_9BACT|nr:hypothetical protein Pla52n_12800 [Stieleria varia]